MCPPRSAAVAPHGAREHGGRCSFSAQVIGVSRLPVMGVWRSTLCELRTSKDLFVSLIFVLLRNVTTQCVYLLDFICSCLIFGTIPILIPV